MFFSLIAFSSPVYPDTPVCPDKFPIANYLTGLKTSQFSYEFDSIELHSCFINMFEISV